MVGKTSDLADNLLSMHEQVPTLNDSMTYCKECGYSLFPSTSHCRTTRLLDTLSPTEAIEAVRELHQPDRNNVCRDCRWPHGFPCPTRRFVDAR